MNMLSPASERFALDTPWLESLQFHPVFDPSTPSSAASSSTSSSAGGLTNPQTVCVRHTDVIVAVGQELRIVNLLDVKRASSSSALGTHQRGRSNPPVLPTFKTLDTPQIDFDIVSISVNSTGKLLVAHGSHRLAVVLLPRSGLGKAASGRVPAKVIVIGQYYHSEHNGLGARIAKARWHPLGHGGTSLLVATRDGTLREYDVGGDAEEPVQVVNLLPLHLQRDLVSRFAKAWPSSGKSRPKASRSRGFSPAPDLSRASASHGADSSASVDTELASFCIGWDQHPQTLASLDRHAQTLEAAVEPGSLAQDDWSPFTIYSVLRNGDLYALCPFLPSRFTMTAAAVQSFTAFVSASAAAQQLGSGGADLTNDDTEQIQAQLEQSKIASRFSALLAKQMTRVVDAAQQELSKGRNANGKRTEPASFGAERSQFGGVSKISEAAAMELDLTEVHVDLTNPWLHEAALFSSTRAQHPRAIPQGPFLLTPAPIELSDERESYASDICVTRIVLPGSSTAESQGHGFLPPSSSPDLRSKDELSVLSVVGDDGRVDLCVVLDAVVPQWEPGGEATLQKQKARALNGRANSKPGRFALSDSEDDDHSSAALLEAETSRHRLPSLLVYETIDLGLDMENLDSDDRGVSRVAPSFTLDPMYRDKLFIHHSEGVHCLSIASWAWALLRVVSGQSDEAFSAAAEPSYDDASASIADELKYFLADKVQTQIAHLVKTVTASVPGDDSAYTIEDAAAAEDSTGSIPVVGFGLVLDAYLGYAAVAVTSDGRCVALELTLGTVAPSFDTVGRKPSTQSPAPGGNRLPTDAAPGARKGLPASRRDDDEEPLYMSLLRPEGPFVPPEPLNTPAGMPVQPRLLIGPAGMGSRAVSTKGPGAAILREAYAGLSSSGAGPSKSSASAVSPTSPLQTITPPILRFLTKALQAFQAEMVEVVRAGNKSQARMDLQHREMVRLLDGLAAARRRYKGFVHGGDPGAAMKTSSSHLSERMAQAVARQKALMDRLDKLLQRLIDGHMGAQASEQELEWFAELREMAVEIGVDPSRNGGGEEGGPVGQKENASVFARAPLQGLKADLDKLQHQLKVLRPTLQEMSKKKQEVNNSGEASKAVYGKGQLRGLEEALSTETDLVVQIKSRITDLNRDLGRTTNLS
ncbi:unnamed protein product [Tilletia controversa]|nr:unnamed protein product [Tilletia controversa]CAD6948309.1 unnamed protein product [Tilletia controversa]CAD6982473.1 unnamed protein product [Tilletia controversa]